MTKSETLAENMQRMGNFVKTQIKRHPLLTTAVIALLSAAMTSIVLAPMVKADDNETVHQLTLFADAFDKITQDYVDEVNQKDLIQAAIQGMLQSLDPHSGFFSDDAFEDFTEEMEGAFGGIGIQITMEEGVVLIIAPIDGTPGFEAGLKPQDLITNIDGDPVLGKTLQEAINQMRGEIGTEVILTILRRSTNEVFDVTVKRGLIPEQSVRALIVEKNIAYFGLSQFTDTTVENLEKEMNRLHEEATEPLIGYVLDLRGNPGGVFTAAVGVADIFLSQGEIVSTRGKRPSDNRSMLAGKRTLAKDLPVIVLINAGSASASEIVAGALQDHQRATLLGTRSFGKGSVQTLVPLAEGTGMRLTTSLYYTPSGRSIQAVGIEPDVEILLDDFEYRDLAGNVIREDYYENEITLEENKDGPVESNVETDFSLILEAAERAESVSSEENIVDVQLRAAVAYLKSLAGQDYDPTRDLITDKDEEEIEPEAEVDTDTEAATDTEADTDTEVDTEPEADTEAATDTEVDTEPEADTEAATDTEVDTEPEAATDTEVDTDTDRKSLDVNANDGIDKTE